MVFDLQGIRNDDFVDPSIKQLNNLEISDIFHCDGLCTTRDHVTENPRLLLWNPYLGQKRWIEPINNLRKVQGRKGLIRDDVYTLGYDTNNHNHKIFRIFVYYRSFDYHNNNCQLVFELYDFNSDSWKILNITLDYIPRSECDPVSLKGNTYFYRNIGVKAFLVCFDFTAERFGPRLPLPLHILDGFHMVNLSCVRDEQLVVLYIDKHFQTKMVEIWISTKIEPNDISRSKFLNVDIKPRDLDGFPKSFYARNFFIDEEKKVLVVFDAYGHEQTEIAYIVGEDGYFKTMNIEEAPRVRKPNPPGLGTYECRDFKLTYYVPILVQLGKRK